MRALLFKSMFNGQAEEAEGPERIPRSSDQREMRSSRRKRETFEEGRNCSQCHMLWRGQYRRLK